MLTRNKEAAYFCPAYQKKEVKTKNDTAYPYYTDNRTVCTTFCSLRRNISAFFKCRNNNLINFLIIIMGVLKKDTMRRCSHFKGESDSNYI